MKKQNARRILAFVLALMLALPVLSIPTFAQQTTVQISQDKQNASASKRPESLFFQDFEALDLGATAGSIKTIVSGPSTAKIVQGALGRHNVLQIDCAAVDTAGKYLVNFNQNKDMFVDITSSVTKDIPITPYCTCPQKCEEGAMYTSCEVCGAEGATPADCKGHVPTDEDCICTKPCVGEEINHDCVVCGGENGNINVCMKPILPEIPTYKYMVEGKFTTKGGVTYVIEGEVNTEDYTILAVKITTDRMKVDANGDPVLDENGKFIIETVEVPFAEVNYNGYKTQEKKDSNGNTVKTEKLDANGNVVMEIVYGADGKPVQVPKVIPLLDENGKQVVEIITYQATDPETGDLLFNEDGTPVMLTKEELQWTTEKTFMTKEITKADGTVEIRIYDGVTPDSNGKVWPKKMVDVKVDKTAPVMVPVMEEVLATAVSGVYITSMGVKDARNGGQNNAGKPAYMQTATIKSDVLVFSSDYYFSADDPETPDVDESLSRGIDIRISAVDDKGTKKNFDFLSVGNPSEGMIELKPHQDAPTELIGGSVKVPLGTWVNILVVADFTSGTYVLYINGDLIASRQNVQIKEQEVDVPVLDAEGNPVMIEKLDKDGKVVMEEVWIDKVEKDENGNVVMTEKLDADGNVVMTEKLDADGNVVMTEKLGEDGQPVLGENGEPEMVPVMVPVMVEKLVTEQVMVDKLDENGKVVMVEKRDELTGAPVWENGKPVMVPVKVPKLDENGKPIYVVVKEQVFEPVLDENGQPVLDENGQPKMQPKMVPVMVVKTQKEKQMLPATNKWVGACIGIAGNSWNLGHFLRNAPVSGYRGYMQIDNVAIYDGDQLPALFDYLGYSIDYNEDYEDLGIGHLVPMSNANATASVEWDEAGEAGGNKAVKVVYADNVDYNYMPPTAGASYLNTSTIVLEANYFLPKGSESRFQSQLRKVGAIVNEEGDPFANYPLNGEKKESPSKDKKSKVYEWIDLYWITASNTTAKLNFTGCKSVVNPIDATDALMHIELPMDEWFALSTVIDLKTGAFTLYVNGVARITGNLIKSLNFHEADGSFTQAKNYELKNISMGSSMWIASKVNKDQKNIGYFYVDDTMMTAMGDLAKMERVEGMLSADIFANGNYVTTVTDNNLFFTSPKITVENRNVFDLKEYLGTDQLLKADDATIRFTSPAGIRFASKVDLEALNALYAMLPQQGDEAVPVDADEVQLLDVSFGTLIVPSDSLKGNSVTFEALDAAGIKYLDIQGTKDHYYDVDGDESTTHIVGSIVDLKEQNVDRLFSAVTYVRIVLPNGIVYNVYANRASKTSAQSLADDAWGEYTPAEQAVIDAYFAAVKPACDTPKKEELNAN